MKYQLTHLTRYQYQQPVVNSYNLACLKPRILPFQHVEQFSLQVTPTADEITPYVDSFGNTRHFIHLQSAHEEFRVQSAAIVAVAPRQLLDILDQGVDFDTLKRHLNDRHDMATLMAKQCTLPSRMIPLLAQAADLWWQCAQPHATVLQNTEALMRLIFQEFKYDPQFSSVVTPVKDVLQHRRGVCQDFAQLAISCLRSHGIPARYVSGYLETIAPQGCERLVGADASHAWFAVFDPQFGWVDFDPTNNLLPDERHLTLAYGRDYADVVPLKGVLQGSGDHVLEVAVDVLPLP